MFKLFDWMAQTGYEHIFFNCQPRDQVTSQQNILKCGYKDMTREDEYQRSRQTDLAMGGTPMSS